jgi:nicotinamide mononucleotide transporter
MRFERLSLVFGSWNIFEKFWLASFILVALSLTVVWQDTPFGFSVFLTGVICVVLAAKGNIWTYLFGAYNSLGYAWISYQNGLFGEMMLNGFYYLPMQIVGWYLWKDLIRNNTVLMRKLSWKAVTVVALSCIVATAGYGILLSNLAGQNTPFIDALTNVLSIVAMILMAQRFREQWVLFICINILSVIMWSFRFASGSLDAATMIVMWSAYLINSIYGLIKWYKGSTVVLPAGVATDGGSLKH